jgi:hypothetical protein
LIHAECIIITWLQKYFFSYNIISVVAMYKNKRHEGVRN